LRGPRLLGALPEHSRLLSWHPRADAWFGTYLRVSIVATGIGHCCSSCNTSSKELTGIATEIELPPCGIERQLNCHLDACLDAAPELKRIAKVITLRRSFGGWLLALWDEKPADW
jgi:hypothetical protein